MRKPTEDESKSFLDRHFKAILPATVGLMGLALVVVQIVIDKNQAGRTARQAEQSGRLDLDTFNLTDRSVYDARVERDNRWQFDMSNMLWENRQSLETCDQLEIFANIAPRESLRMVDAQMQYLRARCNSGEQSSVTIAPPEPETAPPEPETAPPGPETFEISAPSFIRSLNVAVSPDYGSNLILNAPPYNARPNAASYEFEAIGGTYDLEVTYAALESRPVKITVNGVIVNVNGLADKTKGWYENDVGSFFQGKVKLRNGFNLLTFSRDNVFPHIKSFKFTTTQ